MKIQGIIILFVIGLFMACSLCAQPPAVKERFPARGVQPAYETELKTQETVIQIGESTATLTSRYLSITFPEEPSYSQTTKEWVQSLLPQSGDLLGLQSDQSIAHEFKMHGYPVGRLLFYYIQEVDPITGQQKNRYAAYDLLHSKPLTFEACFMPSVWDMVQPLLLDPDLAPSELDGNFSLMPDLMGEDVVVWLPSYAGKPILKPSVIADTQYSGRPYIRIPLKEIQSTWKQDMIDFVEFRNGH